MDRQSKEAMVAELNDIFRTAPAGFLVNYTGLTVEESTELRRRLREQSAQMKVLKNRLARIAIRETPYEPLSHHLTETRALIVGADPVTPAKVVKEYQRRHEKLKLVAGFLVKGDAGQTLDESAIRSLAELPSREELLAKLLGTLNAPVQYLASALNDVPARLARTLDAVARSRGEG